TLLFLPLAHSFARVIQNAVIRARCRMGHSPDIKNLVADLGEFQPTFILAVPRVFEKVYNGARQRAHADGKGAIFDRADRVAVDRYDATRIGTVGRPLPGVTVRVSDDGEILAKGEIVFSGYWNDEDATNDVLDGDGWFHTGDLGALDDDGYLRITGRKKEIIVTAGGKNVAPAVLEDRLRAHPLVSQCIVVGDRQPFIAALVTIDEEAWPKWLAEQGRPAGSSVADLRSDEALRTTIQQAVDEANQAVSRAEA